MIENHIVPPYSIFCPLLSLSLYSLSLRISLNTVQCVTKNNSKCTMMHLWHLWHIQSFLVVVYNRDYKNCVTYLRLNKQLVQACADLEGSVRWRGSDPLSLENEKFTGSAHSSSRLFEDTWIINHIPYRLNQLRVLCDWIS